MYFWLGLLFGISLSGIVAGLILIWTDRPKRNCDVGTADEQQARHHRWCKKHGIDGDNEMNCLHPDLSCDLCVLRWAQMPYGKGDNNDK